MARSRQEKFWLEFHTELHSAESQIKNTVLRAVLWIQIRNNPNVLAGSESESEKKVRIRSRMNIFVKNQKSNT
jgi:hypothetical protein